MSSRRIFTATWWKFRRKLNYRPISPAVLCKRRCKHRNETSRCRRDYYGDCTIPRGRLSIHGTSNFSTTTFLVLRATHVISSSLRDTCTNVWKIIPRANKKTGAVDTDKFVPSFSCRVKGIVQFVEKFLSNWSRNWWDERIDERVVWRNLMDDNFRPELIYLHLF